MKCTNKNHTHVWLGYNDDSDDDTIRCLQCMTTWYIPSNDLPHREIDPALEAQQGYILDAIRSLYHILPVDMLKLIAQRATEIKEWYFADEVEKYQANGAEVNYVQPQEDIFAKYNQTGNVEDLPF